MVKLLAYVKMKLLKICRPNIRPVHRADPRNLVAGRKKKSGHFLKKKKTKKKIICRNEDDEIGTWVIKTEYKRSRPLD